MLNLIKKSITFFAPNRAQTFIYNLIDNDGKFFGTIRHYNDNVSVAGIWAVDWSSLDGTSWLYFAASGKSPFDRGTILNKEETEPKKVFIHTMGWYGAGVSGRHWQDGHRRTPIIGLYDSRNWSL